MEDLPEEDDSGLFFKVDLEIPKKKMGTPSTSSFGQHQP